MQIKSIRKVKNLSGKKILLRVDFNVPIKNGIIKDDYKIKANLLTINFLKKQKCKIIILSHLTNKDSLRPIALHLNKLLINNFYPEEKNKSLVKFKDKIISFETEEEVSDMQEGDIIMLENLFLDTGEEKNSQTFAKNLAQLADIYINNAFSLCNKSYASISAIQGYLPSFGGLLLEREIYSLSRILNPEKPFTIIMGGAKTETKFPLIFKFYESAENILLGGVVANTFLKMLDFEIGKSLIGEDQLKDIKKMKKEFSDHHKRKIISPLDVVVKTCAKDKNKVTLKSIKKVKKDDTILDIGPETITLYAGIIKKSKTILWSGPLGKFEDNHFKHGTIAIARTIAARSTGLAFGVVGGTHTIQALDSTKMRDHVDWVYTCNDAALDFLNKRKMPGLRLITN